MLTSNRMSPRRFAIPAPAPVLDIERRLRIGLGGQIKDARSARRWSVRDIAHRAGVSVDVVYLIEAGRPASTEAALRIVTALGRRLEFQVVDPRRRGEAPQRWVDPVHSAMGELEAGHLRRHGYPLGIDEPYQHYQFAGRADVVAWDLECAALLHLENRTRFPDVQEMAGSFNSKRAYLGEVLADRVGVRRWASETHVIVGLWSAEALHTLRLRQETFRAVCPDPPDAFEGWWRGDPPRSGVTSSLIVIDPVAAGRQRLWVGFEDAMTARPRHRGYADMAARLIREGPQPGPG